MHKGPEGSTAVAQQSPDSCELPKEQPVIWLMKIELMVAIKQYPKLPRSHSHTQLSGESALPQPEDKDPVLEVEGQ